MTIEEHVLQEAWRFYPHTYARKCSNKEYNVYKHIEIISDAITPSLYSGGGYFIVTLPPRHGKSEFISKWLCAWYLDTFKNRNVILTSYGDDLATNFGRWNRNHFLINPHAHARLTPDNSSASNFTTTLGGTMVTAGVNGPITGKGFHLGVIDDPYKNYEDARSPKIRERVLNWYESTFITRREPNGTVIILLTRWHHEDLAGELIKKHPNKFKVINLPAIAEDNDLMGREKGQALCPERYPIEALLEQKSNMHDFKWNALYQQRPSKDTGSIFNRAWWKRYDPRMLVGERGHRVQFWDTAQKPGISNDHTVCATWEKRESGLYLLDVWREKVEAPDLETAYVDMYNKFNPHAVQVEDTSAGSSLIQFSRRKYRHIPVIAYLPKGDKELRAINASPLVKSGICHIPEDAPWAEDFIAEHDNFPTTDEDDQVDTTSQMAEYFNNFESTAEPRIRKL